MTKWTKEYDNDTGPYDDYFKEWWNVTDGNRTYRCNNSDDADFLIAALAQPEPVACMVENDDYGVMVWPIEHINEAGTYCEENEFPILLYTTPPQRPWVGLTDEEIAELHHEIKVRLMGTYKTEDIYRAIEVKLKEKNT